MSSKTQNTQTADPWEPLQEPLMAGMADLTNLYNSGGLQINPYQGDWVADFSRQTMQGRDGLLGVLGQGIDYSNAANPLEAIAGQSTDPTIQNSAAMRQSVLESIMPSINATFAGSGMTGSSLHQQNLARGLSSGMAQQELGIQQARAAEQQARTGQAMGAAGMLPGIYGMQQSAAASPYEAMLRFGAQDQVQAQSEIDALIKRNALQQAAPGQAAKDYLSILSGVGGQFGTNTQTQTQRPGLLGIAGAGLQAASLF